jgi:phage terminase large subunit-like protein
MPRPRGRPKKSVIDQEREQRRLLAESDLEQFIALVAPLRVLGNIHRHVIQQWTSSKVSSHFLTLLPRDHMKSALVAFWTVWQLTKDPTLKILYISSTSPLAVKQLKFMKDILTSDIYRLYWPEMVNQEEALREKWTEREISVDHPLRKKESIREASIFTAGLTTNIVGLHCDICVMDDVVTETNAYDDISRDKVRTQYSYLSSVETTNAREWVVGTRYHPEDLYSDLIQMEVPDYNDDGEIIGHKPLFDIIEQPVESAGDGTGVFLWPRQQRFDGKWFGFDAKILAFKKSQYLNPVKFRAQYYNDPHSSDSSPIQRDRFQYYDTNFLHRKDGKWFFRGNRLNVVAAVDFAYTTGKKSDFTSIVVVGVDNETNYYVLDIERFKTDKISEYFNRILKLHEKWGFYKIRAEITAAQSVIVKDLKESYIRPLGISLSIDEYRPSKIQGSKDERIMAALEPKYANQQMWHFHSGNTQILEEELLSRNPSHDDVKDALAAAVDLAVAPVNIFAKKKDDVHMLSYHGRFGGVI